MELQFTRFWKFDILNFHSQPFSTSNIQTHFNPFLPTQLPSNKIQTPSRFHFIIVLLLNSKIYLEKGTRNNMPSESLFSIVDLETTIAKQFRVLKQKLPSEWWLGSNGRFFGEGFRIRGAFKFHLRLASATVELR